MIRIRKDGWFFVVNDLKESVRDWYMKTYPDDDLGESLRKDTTFWDLVGSMNSGLGGDIVYRLLGGTADSIVRERVFARIAKLVGCDYDDVYHAWLSD